MQLELYHMEHCPYCRKVRAYLDEAGITVSMRDIQKDADANKKLLTVGGKDQVPCLFIDGKPMYESDDIIAWLKENVPAS